MPARTHLPVSLIAAAAALALAACGSDKEPPPFKEVPQAGTTTSAPAPAADTSAGGTVSVVISKLPRREQEALAPLVDARNALADRAQTVAGAAADAKALADRVAAGFNPPSGSSPSVARLRTALGAFSDALRDIATTTTLLPRLSAELRLRATALAKKHPDAAGALVTAKQQVDSAAAALPTLKGTIDIARAKLADQLSKVTVNGDQLRAAVASGSDSTTAAMGKLDDALDQGFGALVAAA